MSQMCSALTLSTIILFKTNEKTRAEILTGVIWSRSMNWIMPYSVIQILPENILLFFCRTNIYFLNLNFWLTFFISSPSGLSVLQMPNILSRFVMTLAANLMSFLQTFLSTVKPVTVRIRRERSRLTIGPNSQSLQTKIEQKIIILKNVEFKRDPNTELVLLVPIQKWTPDNQTFGFSKSGRFGP